ncbi:hypothetical protein B0H13DRAFT_2368995 [Mycena leptocephala]|nr:hypothetical protein B0H13DRAFT_2368995 [Mycena leptocephala]
MLNIEIDEQPEIKKSRVKPGNETPNLKSVSQKKTSTKKISKTVPSDDDYDYNADAYASQNENDLQNLIKGSTQKAKNPKIAMLPKDQKNVTDVVGLFDSENVAAKPETKVQAPLSLPPSKRKTKSTKPAPTTNNDEDVPLAIELTWKELPTHCPAADRLPSQPVDKILSLFNKKKALTEAGGPTAKGVAFTAVEISQAITIQKRRDSVLRLARIVGGRRQLTGTTAKLDASPVWDQFLLSIDYKLLDFSESKKKSAFPAAFRAKRCGYYGPQGEFVIYSSLLRLMSELEQGNNHEQFDCDELTSSNYLSLDDFIRFFLVPAVATCLILEDYPGFDNSHDALFERSNNDEYGQLFFPEDITEPTVHNIHYRNTLSIRSAQDYRDTEPAPPRHRKLVEVRPEIKTETLKVTRQPTFFLPSVRMHTLTLL